MTIRFEEFFSTEKIIACLCRERLAARTRLHENHYLDHLAPGPICSLPLSTQEILGYLPPRSRWLRPPKGVRGKGTFSELLGSLMITVRKLRQRNNPVDSDWIQRQDRLISVIKFRALSSQRVNITRPKIVPSPKDDKSSEYRVLAVYTLEDKILIGQCAAYLRAIFEEYFLPCSFAFRYRTKSKRPPTHHDAFCRLAKFWSDNQEQGCIDAWVAECDIQGFYDTVCHQIVLREYDKAVEWLAQHRKYIDARSRNLVLAYLRSYSYGGYAKPQAEHILARRDPSGTVKDRSQVLKDLHKTLDGYRIGVPQGGALSCLFANLVLHTADEAVMKIVAKHSGKMTYVRYCDDMVIVGENRPDVIKAVTTYCAMLKSLKLPPHQSTRVQYGREFWQMKSKVPYRWAKNASGNTVPWLAFVGYQLRYDGMVRTRPSSIAKELKKQARVTGEFLAHVLPALKKERVHWNRKRMFASLQGRLEAMSVGRGSEWDFKRQELSECWCAGFRCLSLKMLPEDQRIAQTQLRRLDRGKSRQLARVKRKLAGFSKNLGRRTSNKRAVVPYPGKPKSYSGQFERPQ